MVTLWRSVWREPRPVDVPPVRRLDWWLGGAFAAAALLEGVLRPDLTWRPVVTAIALVLLPALLWRRSHPLRSVLIGFGAAGLLSILQLAAGTGELGLYCSLATLIVLYSLVRWGAGREIAAGLIFVAAVVVLGMLVTAASWADVFGGTVLLLLIVALAAVFRYRADLWRRQHIEARNQERVALARELHDIVAHHVSAIAVQAQAGRAVAATHPQIAVEVLGAIESEASRTLAEMRSMVQVLREGDAATYAPQPGVADLSALARAVSTPTLEVSLTCTVSHLPGPVDGAVFRLAQEALTNVTRHARGATRVQIDVRRDADTVRLRIADDGRSDPDAPAEPGFGLLGMAERAKLLGGRFSAGPDPAGGWLVDAELPVGQVR